MNFGEALEFMKQGNAVAHEGWNGKGMFVYLVTGGKYPVQMECAKQFADSEGKVKYNPYMAIKNVNGTVSTWVPSVNDCLANDWYGIKNTDIEKNIPAYILRMQSEYEELRIKNENLYNFLVAEREKPCKTDEYQRELLSIQGEYMRNYLDILYFRIERELTIFNKKLEETKAEGVKTND